ncbi:MAG: diadenylate cyclase CdaA [Oscillospiraceae bacterium]|nr:diadenylate cyclase CdaA [Oscillospiraceae bacterium]
MPDNGSFWADALSFLQRAWAILLSLFSRPVPFNDYFDILLVGLIIYGAVRLLRETRSVQLLKGFFVVVAVWGLINLFRMNASRTLFDQFFNNLVILLMILFQPEIRSMFERVGRSNVSSFRFLPSREPDQTELGDAIRQIVETVSDFSEEQVGALIVFEQETMLREIIKTGTVLDARVTRQLVSSVFFPNSPLHDGAVILRRGSLVAAGCILPLSQIVDLEQKLGTRHRAALGMSEQSDAMVVVVSEETGQISLAYKGHLRREIALAELEERLRGELLAPPKTGKWRERLHEATRKQPGGSDESDK